MPRLPFDDADPPRDDAPPAPSRRRKAADAPWPVAELARRIKGALTDGLPARLRIVGEVSNLSDRNHWFFSLKDHDASIRCVMFASAARKLGFPVRDGLEVIATGRIDFYDAQGSVQLYVDRMEPVGQGAREAALRALIEELKALGYFDPGRRKRLPAIPRKIAVVTSRSAAALQDVIDTASRRWGGCQLVLVDVRVQGPDAAPQVAAALRYLSRHGASRGIEAILLTRGGGSVEDLWAFNERSVADAIFDCALPVVAAIGHETDTTVAELVADLRCATPTQAAMTLIPDKAALADQLRQAERRLSLVTRRQLESARHRLAAASRHALFTRPERLVVEARARLDRAALRLDGVLPRRLAESRRHLESLSRTLDAVGPANVLRRGYSYTLQDDGTLLRSAKEALPGHTLTTVLADGRVTSTVEGGASPPRPVTPTTPASPVPRRRSRQRPRIDPGSDEPTLFA